MKLRSVRIEEVDRKSLKKVRGQTLWANKTEQELRDWFYPETEETFVRVIEIW